MATPDFIIALREKIGTDPLWLSGVTAVVLDGSDVLLVKRTDNGAWTPVTGIIDPGEEPAYAAVREVEEEAGVSSVVERLAWVRVTEPVIYPNGDESQYLDLVFRLAWTGGDPTPADGENTEARWFPLDALPPMSDDMRSRIAAAVEDRPDTRFQAPGR
ncbi:NUDIX hydrolase [Labedella endophytica]|uniref:NUDIX domain-containing protein n=1 Tax=Labedella endophytica TaxID=1523160 RepID=A0A433JSN0_9MICO|nr:NUDIX domain-containing protein [Labedella endophytica]RUR01402.1 NUDIX domain-containing protein [Labedella endophytica]